uniref:shikimate dehydrogenase family protein n=1 Tax=Alloprevotella sp. TaxID=1872471 RepID=UPI003FEEFA43
MKLYGLLGYPLGHSFSAKYFAEKFAKEGIDATYKNFEFAEVADAVAYLLQQDDLQGFNVTIPHKQAIMPYLNGLSAEAEAIGAVNVVCVKRDADGMVKLLGCNSDVVGFSNSIQPLLRPKLHSKALVLGTGGASKAVMYGLRKLGVEPIYVSRTPKEGQLTYNDLTPEVMRDYKVIVNCTPLGMYPKVDACPDIPYQYLTPDHLLYDLVYNPLETLFMKRGAAQGAVVKNGLEMLHLQAEAAWVDWNS